MENIFISYSRHDEAFVHHLVQDLTHAKVETWFDRQDIPGGADWQAEIDRALDACDLLLVIISPAAMISQHVAHEIEHFTTRDKHIIPVLWKTAEVSSDLARRQYINFEDQHHEVAIKQLFVALKQHGVDVADKVVAEDIVLPDQPPQPLKLEDMLASAQSEIWLSGIVLDKVISRHMDVLTDRLAAGVRMRVLVVGLERQVVRDTANWVGRDQLDLAFRILEGMLAIQRMCRSSVDDGTIEIRTLPFRPLFGYVVIDPDGPDSIMTAAPYLYQIDLAKAAQPHLYELPPLFYLAKNSTRRAERDWYARFTSDFQQLWQTGQPWTLVEKCADTAARDQ